MTELSKKVITFGCRLNNLESELIDQQLKQHSIDKNTFIFNTCAVTSEAERKARQSIRKIKKANPNAKWVFGIDGMPEQSHLYRINQDGKKLFEIMLESKKHLSTKPQWQYIAFEYNIDKIEDAKKMAKYHDLEFLLILSSRWDNNSKHLKPKDPKFLPNG